jgi:hypothetical protein
VVVERCPCVVLSKWLYSNETRLVRSNRAEVVRSGSRSVGGT